MSAPEEIGTEDQLLKEAATWFARMRGPDADAHREAFEAWLRLGALHRQAYNRASEIFAMGKHLAERSDLPTVGRTRNGWAEPRRLIPIAALLVIAGMAWFAFGAKLGMRDGAPVADGRGSDVTLRLATAAGETRAARLGDGSLVDLQGRTRIQVRFAADRRDIYLEQGSARFTVAHERRPLVVHAGGGQIRAVGTLFEVTIGADRRVMVRLLEGTVDVIPAPNGGLPRPAPLRLRAGQSTSYAGGSDTAQIAAPNRPFLPTASAGSETGTVREFENVPLSDLVALANRGARRPIRLADPGLGTLRVSGRFRIDDTSLIAERLAALFDLARAEDREGAILISRR